MATLLANGTLKPLWLHATRRDRRETEGFDLSCFVLLRVYCLATTGTFVALKSCSRPLFGHLAGRTWATLDQFSDVGTWRGQGTRLSTIGGIGNSAYIID